MVNSVPTTRTTFICCLLPELLPFQFILIQQPKGSSDTQCDSVIPFCTLLKILQWYPNALKVNSKILKTYINFYWSTTNCHCLTTHYPFTSSPSAGEKSECRVTGFTIQGFTGQKSRGWFGLWPHLTLRIFFPTHAGSWQNSFTWG